MYYKATKLTVREDSENQKTNEDLENINGKLSDRYMKAGLISGGTYTVTEGMSFQGYMQELPEVGGSIRLSGSEWFRSSPIVEINEVKEGEWLVKTRNSVYKLELIRK